MFLTKSTTFIIGPIAELIGIIMNFIFDILGKIGLPNLGLSIIIMTILIYMLMLPLTVRTQKFSKLQRKMQPELQKIQKKYQGKKDSASVAAQQEEMKQVYDKYGVSATGSCVQLIIQMPILFALYRVFYNIPAYLPSVKTAFFPLVDELYKLDPKGAILLAQNADEKYIFSGVSAFAKTLSSSIEGGNVDTIKNTMIDILNKFQSADWATLSEKASSLAGDITTTTAKLNQYNNFLGLNIAESPSSIMRKGGIMIVVALIIPFLAAFTQWLNVKLMPQPKKAEGNDTAAQMQNSMQSMNLFMPLMSAFFCLTLPVGVGIYWFMSAGVRCIQQVFINRRLDQETEEDIIRQAQEKADRKRAKKGLPPQQIAEAAHISTRSIERTEPQAVRPSGRKNMKSKQLEEGSMESYSTKEARPGSLASKANMVKTFDEKHGGRNDDDVYRRYKK